MTKAIIFPTKQECEAYNHQVAVDKGCTGVTAYWFPMQQLTETTTLTKSEYAELYNIPETITTITTTNEEATETVIDNPEYVNLDDEIIVNKWVCVVRNELDIINENGEIIVPQNVVDISGLIAVAEEDYEVFKNIVN